MTRKIAVILLTVTFLSLTVTANSGPTFWEGRPSAELLSVDGDSPVKVVHESLVFDCRHVDDQGWTIGSKVTATYEMHNTEEADHVCMMAFPYIGNLEKQTHNPQVRVDGEAISYGLYLGDPLKRSLYDIEGQLRPLDFESMLHQINHQVLITENIDPDRLYRKVSILRSGGTDRQEVKVTIDFDPQKVHIIALPMNALSASHGHTEISADLRPNEAMDILLVGDPSCAEITSISVANGEGNYSTEEDMIPFKDFYQESLLPYTASLYGNFQFMEALDEVQLYNLMVTAIEEGFQHTFEVLEIDSLASELLRERVMLLVYEVPFQGKGYRQVSVTYEAKATMEGGRRKRDYIFHYFLNPARHWKAFGGLDVTVYGHEHAFEMVGSSIEFEETEAGVYKASLTALPWDDLTFILRESQYEKPIETSSFLPLVWFFAVFGCVVMLSALILITILGRKKIQ